MDLLIRHSGVYQCYIEPLESISSCQFNFSMFILHLQYIPLPVSARLCADFCVCLFLFCHLSLFSYFIFPPSFHLLYIFPSLTAHSFLHSGGGCWICMTVSDVITCSLLPADSWFTFLFIFVLSNCLFSLRGIFVKHSCPCCSASVMLPGKPISSKMNYWRIPAYSCSWLQCKRKCESF